MNTEVTHNGITINLEMYETPVQIAGRGWVHVATLRTACKSDDLSKLIGLELWGKKVLGVEKFATMHQNVGWKIGLLTSERMWSGK